MHENRQGHEIMFQDEKKLSVFPAFFKVNGRYILIVGSGAAALAKIRLIDETTALIVAVAPNPDAQFYAYLKEKGLSPNNENSTIKWLDAPFDSAMLGSAILVFAATGDTAQDRAVATAAHQAHIPVNVVDCPELCDFFTPALVNRAPIAVAVGSEGTGPVLAQYIRSRIDALLCPSIGRIAWFAGRFRERANASVAKGIARRRFWYSVFTGTIARAIMNNDEQLAEKCVLELLDSNHDRNQSVHFLNVSHGVVDWLTLGDQRVLMEADTIIHDSDVVHDILAMARRDADLLAVPPNSLLSIQFVKKNYRERRQVLRLVTDQVRLVKESALLRTDGINFDILPALAIDTVLCSSPVSQNRGTCGTEQVT
ncbi:MAG: uroporphyrin-III C-methyltransferase / precorrin-2 dehydrogenase / sirohydrochlorin ferrochelatase [Candidatus Tokpelaia sp. JSC085]|nr:MAG: uroporphyrin-III C-methyltransferase / precorrin-2 dehydrogenase / sirohydrochlorin ferrochelatase [Candidatus Tokpelaia sp. JSC085]